MRKIILLVSLLCLSATTCLASATLDGRWTNGSGLTWELFREGDGLTGVLNTSGFSHRLRASVDSPTRCQGTCVRRNKSTGRETKMYVQMKLVNENQLRYECTGTDGRDDLPENFTESILYTREQ